jgi:phosphoribosylformimino-5-aminoimidazole carboxamide ribotide isomerase
MKCLPAIDILDGKCVRLSKGDFDKSTIYNESPLDQAQVFENAGFKEIHIVDLNGAKSGNRLNLPIISEIASNTGLKIQLGGGIRSIDSITEAFDLGINKIILGTSILNKKFAREVMQRFDPNKIVFGLDVELKNNIYCLASHGWNEVSDINIFNFIDEIKPINVLVTDITKDGMMTGPNYDLYSVLKSKFSLIKIIASGGIRNINDIQKLKSMKIEHAVIGKAIYEEKIELMELLNVN